MYTIKVKVENNQVNLLTTEIPITEGSLNTLQCEFELPSEYEGLTCVAVFTSYENKHYKRTIVDNKCEIPPDVLKTNKYVILGVYAYNTEEELIYSPYVTGFEVKAGSYTDESEEEMIYTPSDYDKWLEEARVIYLTVTKLYQPTLDNYAEIQRQVAELDEDVDALETRVSTLSATVGEIEETVNNYETKLRDQFKNEFESETLKGDSFYIDDAAERPLELIPYGEPVQTVIEEEVGVTVEGESVVVTDGDVNKEVKADVNGNSYQETTEGYNLVGLEDGIYTINGLTIEVKNGVITINGTSNANTTIQAIPIKKPIPISEGEKISLYAFNNQINENVSFRPLASAGQRQVACSKLNATITTTWYSSDIADKTELTSVNVRVAPNQTLTNFIMKPMYLKGEDLTKPYEPYTGGQASPNTGYPQDVEMIEAYNKVDFSKKPHNGLTLYGVLHTYYDDGSFELDGTATSSTTRRISNIMNKTLKANKTYTMFVEFLSGSVDSNFSHLIQNTDNNAQIAGISTNKSVIHQFTPTEDIENWCYGIYHGKSKIFSKLRLRIMVVEGKYSSINDLPYLPYGHIGLVQRGKNRVEEIFEGYNINNDGSMSPLVGFNINVAKVVKGKKYIVSGTNATAVLGYYNSKPTVNSKTYDNQRYVLDAGVRNFTAPITGYVSLRSLSTDTEVQIEEGETATTYEPYIEPIVHSIDLAGEKLAKVGEIADLLNIGVDGSCKINNTIAKYVFTGDEPISKVEHRFVFSTLKGLIIGSTSADNISPILSNMLIARSPNGTYLKNDGISVDADGIIRIYLTEKEEVTADEFKTFLKELYDAGNPLYIDYVLAEPTTINLPSIEPITLFEGTNVFELVTNLGTTMAVTYNYVTPSPSIDRPSEIFTVQGDYETEKVNENLLPNELKNETKNGITQTVYQDGGVNYKGVSTGTATFEIMSRRNNFLKDNTQYTLSSKNDMPNNVYLRLCDGDNTSNYYEVSGNSNPKEITFVNSKIGDYVRSFVYFGNAQIGSTFDFTIYPKLEVGSTATPFVPHQSTNLPLTLTKELLGEIVTLTEEEAKKLNLDGAGKYVRTDYGRLTDISTMDNYIAPNVVQGFDIKIPDIDNDNANLLMKSNKQKINTYYGTIWRKYDGNYFGLLYPTDNPKAVYFNKLMQNQTIAEVKKWWADNGIELIYPLENPVYEKITDETELEQLSAYDKQIAFYGVNNINTYATDDLVKAPLKLKVTYDKSNRIIIQRQAETIASQEERIAALEETVNTMLGGQ